MLCQKDDEKRRKDKLARTTNLSKRHVKRSGQCQMNERSSLTDRKRLTKLISDEKFLIFCPTSGKARVKVQAGPLTCSLLLTGYTTCTPDTGTLTRDAFENAAFKYGIGRRQRNSICRKLRSNLTQNLSESGAESCLLIQKDIVRCKFFVENCVL